MTKKYDFKIMRLDRDNKTIEIEWDNKLVLSYDIPFDDNGIPLKDQYFLDWVARNVPEDDLRKKERVNLLTDADVNILNGLSGTVEPLSGKNSCGLPGECSVESAMKELVWIASFPKSGNTWFRVMLYETLFGKLVNKDLDDLLPNSLGDLRVHRNTQFIRTHDLPLMHKCPAKAIYLKRDWSGVMQSADNHQEFAGYNVLKTVGASHGEHIAAWESRSDCPVHVIRYEEMCKDPVGIFVKAAEFLGLDAVVAAQVAARVNKAYMRKLEDAGLLGMHVNSAPGFGGKTRFIR
ncbi:MAG: sulfotransferase domain-containing protein [Candidatus Pacebacteria bacterium]|nr:sulfotransferase domain-containing protein [Candidatus Paceibacterota bacterium]